MIIIVYEKQEILSKVFLLFYWAPYAIIFCFILYLTRYNINKTGLHLFCLLKIYFNYNIYNKEI